jgi:hypothetical protein
VEHAIVPLREAGLMPLVYKGAALLTRYGAPGLRPMDDVDLVVPAEALAEAIAVLERAGWARARHSDAVADPGYDVPMAHPSTGGMPIELHYDLQRPSQRTSEVDAARLWSERVETQVCGQVVWGLAPELELLALATHAAKPFHAFNRLIWAVDIAVVSGAGGFDWDLLARRAVELRCRTALAVALRLARRLGAEAPDELVALPGFARRTRALEPVLDPAWPFAVDERNRSAFALALVDDHRARGKLIVDQVRREDGRSPAATAYDLLRAGGRYLRRAPFRGR